MIADGADSFTPLDTEIIIIVKLHSPHTVVLELGQFFTAISLHQAYFCLQLDRRRFGRRKDHTLQVKEPVIFSRDDNPPNNILDSKLALIFERDLKPVELALE